MKNKTYKLYNCPIIIIAVVLLNCFIAVSANDSVNTTRNPVADFDGDGKSDISVFRRSNGFWYVMKSSGGFSAVQFGKERDLLVPGDYDGDGKADFAVLRFSTEIEPIPTIAGENMNWHISLSSNGTFLTKTFGFSGFAFVYDYPFPADYDGDGKTDIAVYTLGDDEYPYYSKVLQSSNNLKVIKQWGKGFDKVVLADYDGDGKVDLTVVRNIYNGSTSEAVWYILQSSDGIMRVERFGSLSDRFVPADYDGDGKADIAVWRYSTGFWYYIKSSDGSFNSVQFGASEDKPVPADYDGDGKTDIAVFRPSNGVWYLLKSKEGFSAQQFGFGDDVPIPSVFVR